MDLLTAYYDDQTWQLHKCDQARTQRKLGYKNSEEFQLVRGAVASYSVQRTGPRAAGLRLLGGCAMKRGGRAAFRGNYAVVPRHTMWTASGR